MPRLAEKLREIWGRFWALSWWWKGPALAIIPLIVLSIGLGLVIAAGGGNETAALSVRLNPTPTGTALKPSPTATTSPAATTTSEARQALAPEVTPLAEPAQQAPAAQPSPRESAPERSLTGAEVTQCEGGQSDGWDDAFNLRPAGFTPYPAPLTLTSDPIACEVLWLAAYDDGYSRGKNDMCSLVNDYIQVSSPEELEFCGLEPAPEPTVVDVDILCATAAQVAGDDLTELVRTIIGSEPIAQQFGKDVTSNYNALCMLGGGYVSPGILCPAAASDTDDVIPKGPLGDTSSPTIYERLVEICLAYFS